MQKKSYSLSYLLDEMIRRQEVSPGKSGTRSGSGTDQVLSLSAGLKIIKALKDADTSQMPLMLLARSTGMKIGPCQEMAERLQAEGLLNIEADDMSGNDMISLTQKGKDLT